MPGLPPWSGAGAAFALPTVARGLTNATASIDPWQTVYLAGQPLPGRAEVDATRGRRIDTKSAPGRDGATFTDSGIAPAHVSISVQIWTQAQLDAMELFVRAIEPTKSRIRDRAMDIVHPSLQVLGIRSVVVESISNLKPTGAPGVYGMQIACIEYRPAGAMTRNVTAPVTSSIAQPNTLNDAIRQRDEAATQLALSSFDLDPT